MLRPVAFVTLGHFAMTMASGMAARGWDLDQVPERSLLGRVGSVIDAALLIPHNAAIHAIPVSWWAIGWPVPAALMLGNSLLYAVVIVFVWRMIASGLKQA